MGLMYTINYSLLSLRLSQLLFVFNLRFHCIISCPNRKGSNKVPCTYFRTLFCSLQVTTDLNIVQHTNLRNLSLSRRKHKYQTWPVLTHCHSCCLLFLIGFCVILISSDTIIVVMEKNRIHPNWYNSFIWKGIFISTGYANTRIEPPNSLNLLYLLLGEEDLHHLLWKTTYAFEDILSNVALSPVSLLPTITI